MASKMNATINLKQMVDKAEKIAERGKNLGSRFINMVDDVTEMQKYWQGESYAKFAKIVNDTIPTLNKMQKYFAETLPEEIIKKRNQYAKADQKPANATLKFVGVMNVNKISIKEQGDELKFDSIRMLVQRDKIDQRFDNILLKNLPNIRDDFKSITWKGSTGDTLRSKFNSNMQETEDAVKKIRTSFRNCLKAQADAMDKAEEANLKSANFADISGLRVISQRANTIEQDLKSKTYDPMA